MNTIKSKTRWDQEGESFRAISIVSHADMEDINDEFRYRCGCEHDCCGHVSSGIAGVRPLSGGRFAVLSYGWRNI